MSVFRLDLINRYLKPHRRTLVLGAISLVIVNILSVAIPFEVRRVIDALQEGFTFKDVLKQSFWIISLASVMAVVRLISRQLVFGVGRQVEVDLRQRLFDHMLIQDPGWVQSIGSGEVITRSTSDIENIRRLLGFAILSLTNTFLAYAFTIPAMIAINPWLTVASISLYPIMLGVVRLFGGRMVNQRRRQQEALSQLSELIQEDLSGISAIKIYGQESAEGKAFSKLNNNYKTAAINLARTASTLFPLLQGISSISLLLLLALGSGLINQGILTIGGLIALILYVERLVFPTALLGFTLNTFQLGQVSLERVEELLTNTKIKIDEITKSYIKSYINILQNEVLGINEIFKLSNKIYRKNIKFLDYVINLSDEDDNKKKFFNENKELFKLIDNDNKESQIREYISNTFKDILKSDGFLLRNCNSSYLRFTTKKIENFIFFNKERKSWGPKHDTFLFEFEIRPKNNLIKFKSTIGPCDENYNRKRLNEIIEMIPNSGKSISPKYSNHHTLAFKIESDLIMVKKEEKLNIELVEIVNEIKKIIINYELHFENHKQELLSLKSMS